MSASDPVLWLVVVAAAHLGFQLTVDLVVYPSLADVPPDRWASAHQRHSRRIAPLVGVLYLPLVVLLVWAVVLEPREPAAWLAVAGGGVLSMVTTAAVAAPTHGRLGSVPDSERPEVLRSLLVADRVRTVGAAVCLVGAVLLLAG